jgi:hypothetical protein
MKVAALGGFEQVPASLITLSRNTVQYQHRASPGQTAQPAHLPSVCWRRRHWKAWSSGLLGLLVVVVLLLVVMPVLLYLVGWAVTRYITKAPHLKGAQDAAQLASARAAVTPPQAR